jgi:pSer/pThr/pTyr-binding forkhead associated (FHA) protein
MEDVGRLVLMRASGQEEAFTLTKTNVSLGRAAVNDIVLQDSKVSRVHAQIACEAEGCTLIDNGSANGVRVNGVRVERALLKPGDVIGIGGNTLRYEHAAPQPEPELIRLDSESELEATLAHATLDINLTDNQGARLAIFTRDKTWEVPLTGAPVTIGRDQSSALVIEQPKVSRHHAVIERRGGGFVIRDLKSTNGTWMGSARVHEHFLSDGDSFRVGDARLVFKDGFEPEELTLVEPPRGKSRLRPVVFVPGFMGSELWLGSERVWPDVPRLFRAPELFHFRNEGRMEPRALVGQVVIVPNLIKQEHYNRLGDFLEEALGYERGKNLLEVPYDWRQDNRVSAQRLAEVIEAWEVREPIILIAHSNGCLVSRYYVERLGGHKRVERLLLMGGPHQGTPKAVASLISGPGLLPFGLMGERLRQAILTFPAMYQLLPTYLCASDHLGQPIRVLEDDSWLPETVRPLVRDAHRFRQELGTHSSVPTVSIFGYGIKTLTSVTGQRNDAGLWQKLQLAVEPRGDDLIPEHSAVLEGSEIHPVLQHHGALYVDNDVKMRLKLELTRHTST